MYQNIQINQEIEPINTLMLERDNWIDKAKKIDKYLQG